MRCLSRRRRGGGKSAHRADANSSTVKALELRLRTRVEHGERYLATAYLVKPLGVFSGPRAAADVVDLCFNTVASLARELLARGIAYASTGRANAKARGPA
jgi:hypothetical protein